MKKAVVFFVSAIIILTLTVTGSLIYLLGGDGNREIIKIPDYVGMKITDVTSDRYFLIKSEGIYSSLPEGEIISQTPYGGAEKKLKPGERYTVKLTVSLGEETDRVPSVVGYHYTEAANILREKGVRVRMMSVYGDIAERDIVLRTSPTIGSEIRKGDTVTIFVGRIRTEEPIRVGEYRGKSQEIAVAEILASGLYISDVELEYSDEVEEGRVISQSIRVGSLVPYGSKISLTVSAGNKKEILHPFGRNAEG